MELCEEFLTRLAPAQLARNAMYPVYGLAEASLAVSFPAVGAPLRTITLNRHRLKVGEPGGARCARPTSDAVQLVCEGRPSPTAACASPTMRTASCRPTASATSTSAATTSRAATTRTRGQRRRLQRRRLAAHRRPRPDARRSSCTSPGAPRRSFSSTARTTTRTTWRRSRSAPRAWSSARWSPRACARAARRPSSWWCSSCTAAAWRSSCRWPRRSRGSSTSRPDSRSREVVPVKRIPKTTSGKIQRHLLEESYADGEFDAELAELAALRAAQRGPASRSRTEIEEKLKTICDAALEGKRVDIHDNLFEVGASSLKLIEIHEQIDREYPGQGGPDRAVRLPDHRRARAPPAEQAGVAARGPWALRRDGAPATARCPPRSMSVPRRGRGRARGAP